MLLLWWKLWSWNCKNSTWRLFIAINYIWCQNFLKSITSYLKGQVIYGGRDWLSEDQRGEWKMKQWAESGDKQILNWHSGVASDSGSSLACCATVLPPCCKYFLIFLFLYRFCFIGLLICGIKYDGHFPVLSLLSFWSSSFAWEDNSTILWKYSSSVFSSCLDVNFNS